MAQAVKNLPAVYETRVQSWVGMITWKRERLPIPILLPGEFHGQRSLVGYNSWDGKESDTTEQLTLYSSISEDKCKIQIDSTPVLTPHPPKMGEFKNLGKGNLGFENVVVHGMVVI